MVRAELGANNFDFLRFCLATLVILSHSYALTRGSEATEPVSILTRGQTNSGELGVHGFFVISGFLVTHSWLRSRGTLDFVRKRLSRIYPGYAVAVLVCALLVVPLASARAGVFDGAWVKSTTFGLATFRGVEYPGLFPANVSHAVNGSLWSISYEAWCYVGVLALGVTGALRRPVLLLPLLAVSITASVVIWGGGYRFHGGIVGRILGAPWAWARLLPYFVSGMLFYLYRERIAFTVPLAGLALAVLAAAVFVPEGLRATMPLAGSYLLFALAFTPRLRLHGWAKPGDFSYGIYLYAFPLQQLILQRLGTIPPLALFALATPAAIVCGAASWHGVERWFLRRTRRPAGPVAVAVAVEPGTAAT